MAWTDEEIKILREEYQKRNGKKNGTLIEVLSNRLNKTKSSIRNKAYELGITKRDKYYTEQEIKMLKECYDKYSMNDLAEMLGRNESNIFRKMKELGLKKTHRVANVINKKKPHRWTEEEKKTNIGKK